MMMQRAGALLRSSFSLSDLQCKGILFTEGVLALASMIVEGVGICTVRLVSISDTVALGHQAQIVRASNIARNLTTSLFIPPVVKTLRNQAVMADVLLLDDACPLSALANEYNPLSEDTTSFLMASIILALEHMHMANVLYRGLSAATVLVSKSSDNHLPGYIQLVDLRFAKHCEGRTFTVTGPAEYLAPEVVAGRGATEASDW
jgi:serine/threonine protein kinase